MDKKETDNKEIRTVTKHTWVDEEDDIKLATRKTLPGLDRKTLHGDEKKTLDGLDPGVERRSLSWDETRARSGDPGAIYGATRVVEKTKKPYEGFINSKQIEDSEEAIRIDDRSTRILGPDERAELFKMKVYPFPKSGSDSQEATNQPKSAKRKHRSVSINDASKFKRFVAVIAIACLLLAVDVGLIVMKAKTATLPIQTEKMIEQTTELQEKNAEISKESAEYGDYKVQKELKASWERLKESLTGEKSE